MRHGISVAKGVRVSTAIGVLRGKIRQGRYADRMKKSQAKTPSGETTSVAYCESPIGWLRITADSKLIYGIEFVKKGGEKNAKNPLLLSCAKQLKEYFAGTRSTFALPLAPQGTPFTKQVWEAMQTVKFGKSVTYGALAKSIRRPSA